MARTKKERLTPDVGRKVIMSKICERLVERLRKEGWHIPEEWEFQQLRPSRAGREAGAWKWTIVAPRGGFDIGSPDTATECVNAERLECGPHGTVYAATSPRK